MRIVIAGGGETGKELAVLLSATHEVVVIESCCSRADWLQQQIDGQVLLGDASSLQTLLAGGVSRADLFVAATGVDEINLLAALTAKKLGSSRAAACLKQPDYWEENHLLRAEFKAVDILLHPIMLTAQAVVKQIVNPGLVASLNFVGGRVALVVFTLAKSSPLVGQKVQQLELPGQAAVCAVTRGGETKARSRDFVLAAGDQVYLIGDALRRQQWLPPQEQVRLPQRVLIGGGSRLGEQIADLLGKEVPDLENVLLDHELTRCEKVAERLPQSQVFHGETAEHTFLSAVVNATTDCFTAAGDDDLLNLMSALLAKSLGIQNIIVVARNHSSQIALRTAELHNIVAPKTLVAEQVLRLLQPPPWQNFAIIGCGPVQALEVVVQAGMPLINQRFGKDRLIDEMIWGALVRQGRFTAPFTAERIQAGDHLVLLLPHGLSAAGASLLAEEKRNKVQFRLGRP